MVDLIYFPFFISIGQKDGSILFIPSLATIKNKENSLTFIAREFAFEFIYIPLHQRNTPSGSENVTLAFSTTYLVL